MFIQRICLIYLLIISILFISTVVAQDHDSTVSVISEGSAIEFKIRLAKHTDEAGFYTITPMVTNSFNHLDLSFQGCSIVEGAGPNEECTMNPDQLSIRCSYPAQTSTHIIQAFSLAHTIKCDLPSPIDFSSAQAHYLQYYVETDADNPQTLTYFFQGAFVKAVETDGVHEWMISIYSSYSEIDLYTDTPSDRAVITTFSSEQFDNFPSPPTITLLYENTHLCKINLDQNILYTLRIGVKLRRNRPYSFPAHLKWRIEQLPDAQFDEMEILYSVITPTEVIYSNKLQAGSQLVPKQSTQWFTFDVSFDDADFGIVTGDILQFTFTPSDSSSLLHTSCSASLTTSSQPDPVHATGSLSQYTIPSLRGTGVYNFNKLSIECHLELDPTRFNLQDILPLSQVVNPTIFLASGDHTTFLYSIKENDYLTQYVVAGLSSRQNASPSLVINLTTYDSSTADGGSIEIRPVDLDNPSHLAITRCYGRTEYRTNVPMPESPLASSVHDGEITLDNYISNGIQGNPLDSDGPASFYYRIPFDFSTASVYPIYECFLYGLDGQVFSPVHVQVVFIPPPYSTVDFSSLTPVEVEGTITNRRYGSHPNSVNPGLPWEWHRQELVHEFQLSHAIDSTSVILPGDHIVLNGTLFNNIHSMECIMSTSKSSITPFSSTMHEFKHHNNVQSIDDAPSTSVNKCKYSILHNTQTHTHPVLGNHLRCDLAPFHSHQHIHPPSSASLINSDTVFLHGSTVVTLDCSATLMRHIRPTPAPSDPDDDDDDGENNPTDPDEEDEDPFDPHMYTLLSGIYTHQAYLPVDVQYMDIDKQPYAFRMLPEMDEMMIQLPVDPQWACYVIMQDPLNPQHETGIEFDCNEQYPQQCLADTNNCNLACKIQTKCVINSGDGPSDLPDSDCLYLASTRPFPFGTVYPQCTNCAQDPQCTIDIQFTTPFVSSINGYPIASIVQTLSPRGSALRYQKNVNGGSTLMVSDRAESISGLQSPTDIQSYDVPIYYDDEITLSWMYSGPLDAVLRVYLHSSDLPTPQHVANVQTSHSAVTIRLDQLDSLLSIAGELNNITFSLEMNYKGNDISPIQTPYPILISETILHASPRCLTRHKQPSYVHEDNEENNVDASQSSTICENYGVCNQSTGTCQCFNGFGGLNCGDEETQCDALECIKQHTVSAEPTCIANPMDPSGLVCNCLPEYHGEQCQHEKLCDLRTCTYGKLISSTGMKQDCKCECNNDFITGASCNQCSLSCRNGGTANTRCTECQCASGYIGLSCQIPVWYHSFTLRNLPQHIVHMILNTSSDSQRQLLTLQQTMVKLLLEDYSRALRETFIIVENGNEADNNTNNPDDHRIRVKVELSQFQAVVPPTNPNAPYVYIQLMLYPADMTDEMLDYAQKHGLTFDWGRITDDLDFFRKFLRDQGIISDDDQLIPDIDDPGCTTRECRDKYVDGEESSSNGARDPFSLVTSPSLFVAVAAILLCLMSH